MKATFNETSLGRAAEELRRGAGRGQGPLGVEGMLRKIVRRSGRGYRACGLSILEEEDDLVQGVYVRLLRRPDAYDPAKSRLTTFAGICAERHVISRASRRDVFRSAVAIEPREEGPSVDLPDRRRTLERDVFAVEVRDAWAGLVEELHALGRVRELAAVEALVASDGDARKAARICGLSPAEIRAGASRALRLSSARTLFRLAREDGVEPPPPPPPPHHHPGFDSREEREREREK